MHHRHWLDSKTMLCAECGKSAEECRREQGRVPIAQSQPLPPQPVRHFFRGHEVFSPAETRKQFGPRFALGGPVDRSVVVAPGEVITDPDRAEQLGLTADARRMRREQAS